MPESGERGPSARTGLHGVLPIGTVLRGYELKSVLGQGAFGITYRALDTTLHRDVAIKEYLPTSLALRDGHTTVIPRSPDHAEQFAWGLARFVERFVAPGKPVDGVRGVLKQIWTVLARESVHCLIMTYT